MTEPILDSYGPQVSLCSYCSRAIDVAYEQSPKRVGYGLRTHKNRVCDGLVLRAMGTGGQNNVQMWGDLKTRDAVNGAAAELERCGWLKMVKKPPSKSGGRPSVVIALHPGLRSGGVVSVMSGGSHPVQDSTNIPGNGANGSDFNKIDRCNNTALYTLPDETPLSCTKGKAPDKTATTSAPTVDGKERGSI